MASAPPEVLRMIAGFLDHRPSLLSFACINRACYDAAFSFLFQALQFKVHRGKDVANAVNAITELLQRGNDFRCVRRLVVRGQIARINLKFDEQLFQKGNQARARYIYQKNNAIWMPLARFIQKLSSLSDFIFDCPDPFSTCLLEALRQCVPYCRLHLDNFYLRDPFGVATASPESDEFRLLTSPCLVAIRFRYELKNEARVGIDSVPQVDVDFHHKIAMMVVRHLAPGLTDVTMKWPSYYPSPRLNVINEVWTPPPSLQRLRLVGNGALHIDSIRKWKTHTDLSVLRTLELQTEDGRDYRTFDWLAINFQLPSLRKLVLDLDPRYEKVQMGQGHVKRLLASLPPLSSLTLKAYGGKLDFVSHHGPRLLEFHLVSYLGYALTTDDVLFLRGNCPVLEEVSLPILRLGGMGSEIITYQVLGMFPNLRRLSLSLDPSCTLPTEPGHRRPTGTSSDFDHMPFCLSGGYGVCHYNQLIRNGSVRKVLENVALDATLAKAIFSIISHARRHQNLTTHLESLTLSISFYDWVEDMLRLDCTHFSGQVESVFRYLTQPLRVKQNPRDDCDEPVVTTVDGPMQGVPKKLPAALQPIWDHIWGGLGTYNWREEWASIPLTQAQEVTES